MQLSKFNIMSKNNNKLLIYNSLKSSFIQVKSQKDISNLLSSNFSELSTAQINLLVDSGIIVDTSKEDILAQKKLFDYIYDNNLELVIMPTVQCNFRCSYCYEDFQMKPLDDAGVKSIVKYLHRVLSQHSSLAIDWFGGEPLLALDQMEKITEQALKCCSRLKIPYYSSITTNGYLLTPENIRKLLKMHVYSMQITVDGCERSHNRNRPLANGKPTFKTIINNLLYIRDNIKSPYLKIAIRCNLSKSSLTDIPEFMDKLNEWFGADPRFNFYFHPIEDWGGNNVKKIKEDLLNGADSFFEILYNCQSKIKIENYFKRLSFMPVCNSIKVNRYVIDPALNIFKCSLYRASSNNQIGKLENGKMNIDKEKAAYWSFDTIMNYDLCVKNCPSYANCFARLCPYKMNGNTLFKCRGQTDKISKLLDIDYKFSPQKYIEI